MAIEIRTPAEDELRAAMKAGAAGFGEELRDDDYERERQSIDPGRFLCAYDDGRPVGTAAAYTFELTIPGGAVPAAGVTWVAVLPSHRRRGVLTQFMRHQLDDVHARGEPVAILWASEGPIYGRFGYGIAAPNVSLEADRSRFRLRGDAAPSATIRLLDAEEAYPAFVDVYERVRPQRPGMLSRSEHWWHAHRLIDVEHIRRGAGPKFYAVVELDGRPEGYAMYRIKENWEGGLPRSEVRVIEAIAASPDATRELWRFLFSIDLTARVDADIFDPASPLFLLVDDPRSLGLKVGDGLYLRLVDLEASLRARSYAASDPVVLDVRDDLCPWNGGRWRVGPDVAHVDDDPDIRLDVTDLASAYLGGFTFEELVAAGRAEELRAGAVPRASALFRTAQAPFCPEVF